MAHQPPRGTARERILGRLQERPSSAFELGRDLTIAPSIVREELDDLAQEGLVYRDANVGTELNVDWRWKARSGKGIR